MRNHGDNQGTSLLGRREVVGRDDAPVKDEGSPASPLNLMKVQPRYKFHRDIERLGLSGAHRQRATPKRIGDRS